MGLRLRAPTRTAKGRAMRPLVRASTTTVASVTGSGLEDAGAVLASTSAVLAQEVGTAISRLTNEADSLVVEGTGAPPSVRPRTAVEVPSRAANEVRFRSVRGRARAAPAGREASKVTSNARSAT